ncbi:hypothetical protein GCM10009750_32300 [Agromyces salentinus]|uniref:Uncharacterized protein n=1 Tax=Agromyces salentinus TaxID=269421 RepID=A0ABP4Z6Q2_9MICO
MVANTRMSTNQAIHAYWVSTSNSFSFARPHYRNYQDDGCRGGLISSVRRIAGTDRSDPNCPEETRT